MYKLAILAVVFAAAQAQVVSPYAGGHLGYGYAGLNYGAAPAFAHGYAGHNLGYANGFAGHNLGYAPAYATGYAGLNYAHAAPAVAVAAPAVAYAAAPQVVANTYAVPAVREVHQAPIVEHIAEKVEQHGYSVAY